MEEKVFVVPVDKISHLINGKNYDLITADELEINKLVEEAGFFMERQKAEHDFNFKQIIPYIVISHNDSWVLVTRTKKQTEKRLHNLMSMGIGGHINPVDHGNESVVIEGLKRELEEEVEIKDGYKIKFCGIINDDTNEVSRVHMGFLYNIILDNDYFKIKESDKMIGQWVKEENLKEFYDNFETWTKIVYDKLINKKI